jgi:hypothetical protein
MTWLDGVIARAAAAAPQPARRGYWPLWVIGSGCFVSIWAGWVGLGSLAGFGPVELLPGIASGFRPDTSITLPLSMEVYGSYALRYWIDRRTPARARRYAMWTALSALALGLAGQGAYHLMTAHHFTPATTPWPVVVLVAWVPVIAFALGAGLRHMLNEAEQDEVPAVAEPAAPGSAEEAPQDVAAPAEPAAAGPVMAYPRQVPVLPQAPARVPAQRPRPRAVPPQDGKRLPMPSGTALRELLAGPLSARKIAGSYAVSRYEATKMKNLFEAGELAIEDDEEASEHAA